MEKKTPWWRKKKLKLLLKPFYRYKQCLFHFVNSCCKWNVLSFMPKKNLNFKATPLTPNWQQKVEAEMGVCLECICVCHFKPLNLLGSRGSKSFLSAVICLCQPPKRVWDEEGHISQTHTLSSAKGPVCANDILRATHTPGTTAWEHVLRLWQNWMKSNWKYPPTPSQKRRERGVKGGRKKARDSKCETESEWTIQLSLGKINESLNSSLCWAKCALVFERW